MAENQKKARKQTWINNGGVLNSSEVLNFLSNIMKTTFIILSNFIEYTGAWPSLLGFLGLPSLPLATKIFSTNVAMFITFCDLDPAWSTSTSEEVGAYNRSYNRSCAWKPPITQIDTSYFTCARKKLLKVNILVQILQDTVLWSAPTRGPQVHHFGILV